MTWDELWAGQRVYDPKASGRSDYDQEAESDKWGTVKLLTDKYVTIEWDNGCCAGFPRKDGQDIGGWWGSHKVDPVDTLLDEVVQEAS